MGIDEILFVIRLCRPSLQGFTCRLQLLPYSTALPCGLTTIRLYSVRTGLKMKPDVQFDNVGLRYTDGPEVLRDVSFTLTTGSFHFLTGPSGAGKSTILQLLFLALRPTRGLISLFGYDTATINGDNLPKLRKQIGVVFQDFHLIDHLSAFDNVALPLRISNVPENDIRIHVEELLIWVGLKDRMGARPNVLSGGEKQRVAIARAVISRPKLLLADEPTGNVDTSLGERLLLLFEQLNRHGTTIVIATHDDHLVQRFNKPVLALEAGEINRQPVSAPSYQRDVR